MIRCSLLAIALGACGTKSQVTTEVTPDKPVAPVPSTPKAKLDPLAELATIPLCAEGTDLKARVAELARLDVADVRDASCTTGLFPKPGWAIETRFNSTEDDGSSSVLEALLIVTLDGEVVSRQQRLLTAEEAASAIDELRGFDFDGDDVDELLSIYVANRKGHARKRMLVRRLATSAWETALDRQFEYDDAVVRCTAQWGLGSSKVVFDPIDLPKRASDQCIATPETWSLGPSGTFIKQRS